MRARNLALLRSADAETAAVMLGGRAARSAASAVQHVRNHRPIQKERLQARISNRSRHRVDVGDRALLRVAREWGAGTGERFVTSRADRGSEFGAFDRLDPLKLLDRQGDGVFR